MYTHKHFRRLHEYEYNRAHIHTFTYSLIIVDTHTSTYTHVHMRAHEYKIPSSGKHSSSTFKSNGTNTHSHNHSRLYRASFRLESLALSFFFCSVCASLYFDHSLVFLLCMNLYICAYVIPTTANRFRLYIRVKCTQFFNAQRFCMYMLNLE